MSNFFSDINQTLEEGKKRWEEIEALCTQIKADMEINLYNHPDLFRVIMLLVDHLRPMNPSSDQLNEVAKGLGDMLASFGRK